MEPPDCVFCGESPDSDRIRVSPSGFESCTGYHARPLSADGTGRLFWPPAGVRGALGLRGLLLNRPSSCQRLTRVLPDFPRLMQNLVQTDPLHFTAVTIAAIPTRIPSGRSSHTSLTFASRGSRISATQWPHRAPDLGVAIQAGESLSCSAEPGHTGTSGRGWRDLATAIHVMAHRGSQPQGHVALLVIDHLEEGPNSAPSMVASSVVSVLLSAPALLSSASCSCPCPSCLCHPLRGSFRPTWREESAAWIHLAISEVRYLATYG